MKVSHYMHSDPVTVQLSAPLSEAKRVMDEKGFSLLLVVDEERGLKGFITKGALKGVTDLETPLEKACFEARFAVNPEDTLEKAALIMIDNQLVLLPVIDGKKLVGVISQSEVLRALARALGIGLEGTRITLKLPHDSDGKTIYKVLETFDEQGVKLVSLARGGKTDRYQELIARVQEISDKDALTQKLEAILRQE
ncbi:CBS domain-containing protein [Candidatus Bipolaricaulota bacterium]|nr:CBS domain-containing protein [Candidatus Bipolaricaulota bacterium]HHR85825.1 CBS domain-containing protein [Candidatus Acetothermia bacterium]